MVYPATGLPVWWVRKNQRPPGVVPGGALKTGNRDRACPEKPAANGRKLLTRVRALGCPTP